MIINKTGGNWNEAPTLAHFRNALTGDMVGWYTSISVFYDTPLTWDLLKTKFERDFQAASAASKVIEKLTETIQQDHENVHKCLQIPEQMWNHIGRLKRKSVIKDKISTWL